MSRLADLNRRTRAGRAFLDGRPDLSVVQSNQHLAKVQLIDPRTVEIHPPRWLWRQWLPQDMLTLLAGSPKTGKTTIAMKVAATVSSGGQWPDGTQAQPGNVLIWSGEDIAQVLIPRLQMNGGDFSRIRLVGGVKRFDTEQAFDPSEDMPALQRAIEEFGGCALLILDPVVSAVSGDSHKNAEVRRGLQPVVDLAETMGCAVLGITHLTKFSQGKDPLERITGSLAFGALARMTHVAIVGQDNDGTKTRLMLRAASNVGPADGGFEYRIEPTSMLSQAGELIETTRLDWVKSVEGDARKIIHEAEASAENQDDSRSEAEEWLIGLLRDRGGHADRNDVMTAARSAGFSERTVHRARESAGIDCKMNGFGAAKRSSWLLPDVLMPTMPKRLLDASHHPTNGTIGTYGTNDAIAGVTASSVTGINASHANPASHAMSPESGKNGTDGDNIEVVL